mmetsp:Transcript_2336/g.5558  ORF Transcript_2336/g.5558 Transcript_2336/m.5558 type:complete len:294 (-) Transcript_2336:567-1448(-)
MLATRGAMALRGLSRCTLAPGPALLARSVRHFSSEGGLVSIEKLPSNAKIAVVKMARAPVNSFNLPLAQELHNAIDTLEQDPTVQGMILTSSCNKIFSAGLDLMVLYKPDEAELKKFWTQMQDLFLKLYGTKLATVAAVNGAAPAAGCLLALSCDYRVMSKGYAMGMNETKFGLVAPSWFQSTLISTVGQRQAEILLLRGTLVPTDKAVQIGLIDEEVEEGELMASAEKAMMSLCAVNDRARALTKRAMRMNNIHVLQETKELDLDWFVQYAFSEEVQAGLDAYIKSLQSKKK